MNIDDFKDAFSVSSDASDWVGRAQARAQGALDQLRRLLAAWEADDTPSGWAPFSTQADGLRPQITASASLPAHEALPALEDLTARLVALRDAALDARRATLGPALAAWERQVQGIRARIDALDPDTVADERAALSALVTEAQGRADTCDLGLARAVLAEAEQGTAAAEAIAAEAAQARREQWACVAQNMLALRAKGVPDALEAELRDLQLRAVRIQGLLSERQHSRVIELCIQFVLESERVSTLADRHRTWAAAHARITGQADGVLDVEAELGASADAALWRDYARAMTILEALLPRVAAAEQRKADDDELTQLLDAVPEAVSALGSDFVDDADHLQALSAEVRDLRDGGDTSAARAASVRLSVALSLAQRVSAQPELADFLRQQHLVGQISDLEAEVAAIPPPAPERHELSALLTMASEHAEKGRFADAATVLDAAAVSIREATLAATLRVECEALYEEADISMSPLWFHELGADAGEEIDALQAALDDARAQLDAGPDEALKPVLAKLARDADALVISLDLRLGTVSEDGLQTLLGRDGGTAVLDHLVAEPPAPISEAAMVGVLKARFGVDVSIESETDTKGASLSLQRIYDLFRQVPEHHIAENSSLQEVIFHADKDDMSSYLEGVAQVTLRCGRADTAPVVSLMTDDALAAVEDSHRPVDGAEANHFDWSTLHEVGHAVEHKLGFMKGRTEDASFGGWREHGADIDEIAAAAAARFQYDADYIAQQMRGRPPLPPPRPPEVSAEAWAARRAAVDAWCATVCGALWDDYAASCDAALGGVVYQQAYPNRWVSYHLSARSKATSAYQFRSPIEWFAELYAAYHSGMLRESHSAVSWLEGL